MSVTVSVRCTATEPGDYELTATLLIQQDGFVNFRGHAHDSGFFGGEYLVAVWFPGVLDAQGRTITFTRVHDIAGTIGGGDSRDDDWDLDGPSDPAMKQFISDHWDAFATSEVRWNMLFDSYAQTDLSVVLFGLFAEIGITAVVVSLLG